VVGGSTALCLWPAEAKKATAWAMAFSFVAGTGFEPVTSGL
jgi:hypothetical protein